MKLKVLMGKQKKGSLHCGLSCLQMVMTYYGDKVSIPELLKQLQVYRWGIFAAELGKIAIKYDYKVFAVQYDTSIFDNSILNINQKQLKKFKAYLRKAKRISQYAYIQVKKVVELIEAGSRYSTKLPDNKLIDNYLKKKIPVIVAVNKGSLRGNPKFKKRGHYLVIRGMEEDYYIVNDPNPHYKRPYKIEKQKLLHALWLNGSIILVIWK